MPAGRPTVFLDVSRLLSRAGRENATGIDRVELAYVRRLLAADLDTRLVAVGRTAVRVVDKARALAAIGRLDRHWSGVPAADAPLEPRLARFLAGAPAEPHLPPPAPGLARRLWTDLALSGADPDAAAIRRALALGRGPTVSEAARAAGPAVYLNVSHHHLEKPWVLRSLGGLRRTVFVHDVIPIDFPEFSRAGDADKHRRRMASVAADADLVLVNSAHTRDRVGAVLSGLGRAAGGIAVAPLGIDLAPLAAAGVPPTAAHPYFLAVGTIEARKNHLTLLAAWRMLVARHGPAAPRLVVVGRRGWEVEQVIDSLERSDLLRPVVCEAGPVDDAALRRLIAGARALLMPSLAEGFGLPVAEALAAGVPVLASDIPAHREVGAGVPDFLDPLDTAAWAGAVELYATPDAPARRAQLSRLAGWRPPTWEAHFAAVASLLKLPI
ncbi:glycosyltransferase family 4 protein [Prosthecomicrobium sp. N25]|uniref:glycosyltransferase family 4 protein n=1 Tax=Prosthecomicrobium sp. N25 TaxID=3129254 RepID=UPI003076E9E6